jgi:monofunctional glycosyltransferase
MDSMSRAGRAISPSTGAAASSRSSRRSVSAAAALSRAENEASGRGSGLAAGRDMEGIVLNSAAMTSIRSPHGKSHGASRGFLGRALRAAFVAILILLLLPYLLVPLYRFVDPVSTLMLARWAVGARVVRTNVPLERIAPILPRTVIASEDGQFCRHRGIDWGQLREAFQEADDISEMRGGSTITQQVVKNLFLWPGRSVVRKVLEFPLALWTDLVLPKRRILEIYLNIAEWGPRGEFGVEAGARRAFNKSARDLTAGEAALLAAVLPNPKRRSARQPGPAVRRVAGIVQGRAARSGAIDACVRPRGTP